jgi:hypothetical protein
MAALSPLTTLAQAHGFEFTDIARVGSDLRVMARPPRRTAFLSTT